MAASFSLFFFGLESESVCIACQSDVFLTLQALSEICRDQYRSMDWRSALNFWFWKRPAIHWPSSCSRVFSLTTMGKPSAAGYPSFRVLSCLTWGEKAVDWKGVRGYSCVFLFLLLCAECYRDWCELTRDPARVFIPSLWWLRSTHLCEMLPLAGIDQIVRQPLHGGVKKAHPRELFMKRQSWGGLVNAKTPLAW